LAAILHGERGGGGPPTRENIDLISVVLVAWMGPLPPPPPPPVRYPNDSIREDQKEVQYTMLPIYRVVGLCEHTIRL
jgi:hypothetical protein